MTGYQETLTDPSYFKQIVVMTAPHIGNTGMNDEDAESRRIWVAGYVVQGSRPQAQSNWRSQRALGDDLAEQGIVGHVGNRHPQAHAHAAIRRLDARRSVLGRGAGRRRGAACERVRAASRWPARTSRTQVSIDGDYVIEPPEGVETVAHVVAVDLGIKAMTPELMAQRGIKVTVVPSSAGRRHEILAREPDGVFFSNGPGDPGVADRSVGGGARDPRRARCRSSASASATSCLGARSATAPTSSASATAASTSPSWTAPPARWR